MIDLPTTNGHDAVRDPKRIEKVLAAVRAAWYENPDLRLTQLLFNHAAGPGETAGRFYNTEDDDLVILIQTDARRRETKA